MSSASPSKKSDDKEYLRVQSKATSIVRKEIVPQGDKLRFVVLFRIKGSLTRIYANFYSVLKKDSYGDAIN